MCHARSARGSLGAHPSWWVILLVSLVPLAVRTCGYTAWAQEADPPRGILSEWFGSFSRLIARADFPSENGGKGITEGVPRILLVGDSWAKRPWNSRILKTVLEANGVYNVSEKGAVTAISGSTAIEWSQGSFLSLITGEFAAYPAIDCVHLSLGGNDFLLQWSDSMSDEAEMALFQSIADNIESVLQHILSLGPNIEIGFCGYDYLLLGLPHNEALLRLETYMQTLVQGYPRVTYISNYGLMQYHYGFPSQSIPPRTLIPPGDPTLGAPPEAMRDSIHLTDAGYIVLFQHCFDVFYGSKFPASEPWTPTPTETSTPTPTLIPTATPTGTPTREPNTGVDNWGLFQ